MHIETICRVDVQLDAKMCRRNSTEQAVQAWIFSGLVFTTAQVVHITARITFIQITTKLHEIETNLLSERLTKG